jgi:pimeloyl-ACP methyl ester carboxylesterase
MTEEPSLRVRTGTSLLLSWPSNHFAIDFIIKDRCNHTIVVIPHTVLVFIPGNPGLIEWYMDCFRQMVARLGPGFAARGVSNAGHGLTEEIVNVADTSNNKDRSTCIPWTVDGQVLHNKIAYMDLVENEFSDERLKYRTMDTSEERNTNRCTMPQYIFVSHSIGAHFTQRLCMLRLDILRRTKLLIHLTPFIRMKAPSSKQALLDFLASHPITTIAIHEQMFRLFGHCQKIW